MSLYHTSNMAVASYLFAFGKKHDVEIRYAKRIKGPGRFDFCFTDPQKKCNELEIEFANSVCRPFDDAKGTLKMLLSSNDNRG